MKRFYNRKSHTITYMLALIIGLSSCVRGDVTNLVQTIKNESSDFGFTTSKDFNIKIVTSNNNNESIPDVLFKIYSSDPFSYSSDSALLFQGAPLVGSGKTNNEGEYTLITSTGTYKENLFVFADYPGFPERQVVALNDRTVNLIHDFSDTIVEERFPDEIISNANETNQNQLGDWNQLGFPDYCDSRNKLSHVQLNEISQTLPSGKSLIQNNPEYINTPEHLYLQKPCEIWLTFIHEGTNWKNTIGYYTFNANTIPTSANTVKNKTIVFPNASFVNDGGSLVCGDRIQLKYWDEIESEYVDTFPAGTIIGLYLNAKGWKNGIQPGEYTHYSNKEWNIAENVNDQKQNIILYDDARDNFVIGFEDIARNSNISDGDFNDILLLVSTSAENSINNVFYPRIKSITDSDLDGASDNVDHYPNDADKAFNLFYPNNSISGTLLFEDTWPLVGDFDFNDLVVSYHFNQITNANNKITQIEATFKLKASGTELQNGFGFQLNAIPDEIQSVTGSSLRDSYIQLMSNGCEAKQEKAVIIVFDNALKEFDNTGNTTIVNTDLTQSKLNEPIFKIIIDLKEPIGVESFGLPPYNPFIIINGDRNKEIHLPNYQPTDLADRTLLGMDDDDSDEIIGKFYASRQVLPWSMNLTQDIPYPIEQVDIRKAYVNYEEWATNLGVLSLDWYLDKNGFRDESQLYLK